MWRIAKYFSYQKNTKNSGQNFDLTRYVLIVTKLFWHLQNNREGMLKSYLHSQDILSVLGSLPE